MRTALATALMMAAALGWAAELSAADAKTEAAAKAAPAKPADEVAANETTSASIATENERPFKPPGGYKSKRVNGELVYCTKVLIYNSRFTQEECRTEAQLREMERSKRTAHGDMDRLSRACSGVGCTRR